jgi:hypothetical protein
MEPQIRRAPVGPLNSVTKEADILAAETKRDKQIFKGPRKIYLKIFEELSKEKDYV